MKTETVMIAFFFNGPQETSISNKKVRKFLQKDITCFSSLKMNETEG